MENGQTRAKLWLGPNKDDTGWCSVVSAKGDMLLEPLNRSSRTSQEAVSSATASAANGTVVASSTTVVVSRADREVSPVRARPADSPPSSSKENTTKGSVAEVSDPVDSFDTETETETESESDDE